MDPSVQAKLDTFFGQYKFLRYKKGETILRAGDPLFAIFYLTKGLVRQYCISEDGNELTIHLFRPPSFFPMMLAVDATIESSYDFEAITPVMAWRAPTKDVLTFVRREPDVLFDLTKRFAAALNGLSIRISQLAAKNARAALSSLLIYLGRSIGTTQDNNIIITIPLTHQDLALWTGFTRETTSRHMEQFIKEGLIEDDRQTIIIKNLAELEKLQLKI